MDVAEEESAVEAVREVLRSKRLFRGGGVPDPAVPPKTDAFERAFAALVESDHALAVNSGTSALVCALVGLGVGPRDEVIVPAYTWIATATAVLAVGAVPIVAEIDASLTLDPADVRSKISPYTKAIAAVHMRGAPAAMEQLTELARQHDLWLLEDTAQAVGASFRGRRLGTIGDVGAYSFQMSKIITAGEGGMVVTNSEPVHRRAAMYHDAASIHDRGISAAEWLPGLNLRMSELHAAVLLVQLDRLDELLEEMRERKSRLKGMVESELDQHGISFRTLHDPRGEAAIALILLLPDGESASRFTASLVRENVPAYRLCENGVQTGERINPQVYTSWKPLLEKRGWSASGDPWARHPRHTDYRPDACPRTIELLSRAVNIDITPNHTGTQLEQIATVIVEAAGALDGLGRL